MLRPLTPDQEDARKRDQHLDRPASGVVLAGKIVRVLRVGLSGGIGSGKSTVARRLTEHGAVLIDADALAREVVEPGTEGLDQLVRTFGAEILDSDGALNRQALARRVFDDDAARAELNAITHPRIASLTEQRMARSPADAIVVHDIPLLVEAGYAANYHLVAIVDAPEEIRVGRLVARGLDAADARSRIRAQATTEQRRAAADVWLDNSTDEAQLRAAVDELWANRLVGFERNVRMHQRTPKMPPRVVDPDPTWPRQAARLIARVRRAADDLAVGVEHVGSTAVPELPAKDVVDLQLAVRSLADAERLAGPLGEAGFPVVNPAAMDTPHSVCPGPVQWTKSFHAAADPGRPAHLHVRVQGSASWRLALLFRDWLRAEPNVRQEYLAVKLELAARYAADATTDRYAEAKEAWFAGALPRAEKWARRVGWQPVG